MTSLAITPTLLRTAQYGTVSQRGSRRGTFRNPAAAAHYVQAHAGHGTLYAPESEQAIADLVPAPGVVSQQHPEWAVSVPLSVPVPGFTTPHVRASAVDIDEGLSGDYDPSDPNDIALLRIDLHLVDAANPDAEPVIVSDGSWCTAGVGLHDSPTQIVEVLHRAAVRAGEQIGVRPVEINTFGEAYGGSFDWLSHLESTYGMDVGFPVCRDYAPDTSAADAFDAVICTLCHHTQAVHELELLV